MKFWINKIIILYPYHFCTLHFFKTFDFDEFLTFSVRGYPFQKLRFWSIFDIFSKGYPFQNLQFGRFSTTWYTFCQFCWFLSTLVFFPLPWDLYVLGLNYKDHFVLKIFQFLSALERSKVNYICSRFRNLINGSPKFWFWN